MFTIIIFNIHKFFKIIFLPFTVISFIFDKSKELIKEAILNLDFTFYDFQKLFIFPSILIKEKIIQLIKYFLGRMLKYSKRLLQFSLILIVFSFISIFITYFCYKKLSFPSIIQTNLNFNFLNERLLAAKIKNGYNDDYFITDLYRNYNYNIIVELDISRNENSIQEGNFESELQLISKQKEIKSIKKIIFLDQNDSLTQNTINLFLLPFKLIGAFNEEKLQIEFFKNFQMSTFPIMKISIFVTNTKLNIKKGRLIFQPITGWFIYFLGYLKIIFTPIFFFMILGIQLLAFFRLKWMGNQETTTSLDDNKDN